MGFFILAGLLWGSPSVSHAQTQQAAEVLLNLESIKLELERVRQETVRLGLETKGEMLRELELLRHEMELVRREFQRELDRFRGIAREEKFETVAVIEKFKVSVKKLLDEVQDRLEREREVFERLHADAQDSAELDQAGAAFSGESPDDFNSLVSPANRNQVAKEQVVLPRIKTLGPDKSLVFDAVESKTPGLDFENGDGKARGRFSEFGDIDSPDGKLQYFPKFYRLPGTEEDTGPSILERHRQALEKFSKQIRTVKGRLLQSNRATARPLLLNLGEAYLGSEHYMQQVDRESSRKLVESDAFTGLILGGYQAAVLAFKSALRLEPDDAETNVTLSNIYDEMEDGQNAVNHLERARYLYQEDNRPSMARIAKIKLRSLRSKYPETWICSQGTAVPCEQNAGRLNVGGDQFQGNLIFHQAGFPPTPIENQ